MNPGIFISYSRDDEKQAMHLLALLRREGYSVWIDQEAIAGASIWSDEIVQNIKQSEIFIALLSHTSVSSPNVSKEIALAAEHGKVILPIEIGNVALPGMLEYALAGIQRTNFHDEESILRAVRSQIARLEGSELERGSSRQKRLTISSPKVFIPLAGLVVVIASLIIILGHSAGSPPSANAVVVLPFETLNLDRDSTRNLDIFSDGLLTRLSSIPLLETVGASISSAYKNSELNGLAIAKELKARFVIEGLVRKSHDVNFVSVRIIDSKHGGEIWEQSYSGNNSELFTIRQRLTSDLTGTLAGITSMELDIQKSEENFAAHPNDAAACASLARLVLPSDKARALALLNRAMQLDSTNIAYYLSAGIVATREGIGSAKDIGKAAVALCKKRMAQYPDSVGLTSSYATALDLAGEGPKAEEIYDSLLHLYPANVNLNYNAACCLAKQGKADPALDILEKLFAFAPGKRAEVLSDPDFDNIRSFPRYQKVMYGSTP